MWIKRIVVVSIVVLALLPFYTSQAQESAPAPAPDVISAVLQDASRLSGQKLTAQNLDWRSITFDNTVLDCGSVGGPLPAHLYGYIIDVSLSNGALLDYRTVTSTDQLFQCTDNGPGPVIKIIHKGTAPASVSLPNIPERGSLPADTDKLVRHELTRTGLGTLNAVVYSADGKTIALGGSLGIWLLTDDLTPIVHLSGSAFPVTALAWRPDGKQLATADQDSVVQVWDVASGDAQTLDQLEPSPDGDYYTGSVSYSPDGSRLASASRNGAVKVWDTSSGKLVSTIQTASDVHAVAWNPNGNRLAVGGEANDKPLVLVYDAATGKQQAVFSQNDDQDGVVIEAPILGLQWSPDRQSLFLVPPGGQDVTPISWTPDTGEISAYDVFIPCGDVATGVFPAPDTLTYIVGMENCESGTQWGDVYVWGQRPDLKIPLGNPMETVPTADEGIAALGWNPDSKHFVVIRGSGGVALHDITQMTANGNANVLDVLQKFELFGSIAAEPDESEQSNRQSYLPDPEWEVIDPDVFHNPQTSPNGKTVVANGFDDHAPIGGNIVVLLDAYTGKQIKVLDAPPSYAKPESGDCDFSDGCWPAFTWSADGTRILGDNSGLATTVWDRTSGHVLYNSITDRGCDWAADNTRLVCQFKDSIWAVDTRTGKHTTLSSAAGDNRSNVVWGPQDVAIMEAGNQIGIWNRTLDKQILDVPGVQIEWSADGWQCSVLDAEGNASVYNLRTGSIMFQMQGNSGPIEFTAFSPNGRYIAPTDLTGEIDVWDTATGQKMLRLVGHHGPLALTPKWNSDGSQITSIGTDGTTRVWSAR